MNVTAIVVTRGDVDLTPVLDSLPEEWQKVVWDNSGKVDCYGEGFLVTNEETNPFTGEPRPALGDLSVYGRYAAIALTANPLIYVQDDDVVVSDPRSIAQAYRTMAWHPNGRGAVVCNMPEEFRHDFYQDHALVGFGAAFHRSTPARAFLRFESAGPKTGTLRFTEFFRRTCDIVVTGLSPRIVVDVPKENLPWAEDDSRMWRQPEHVAERTEMLDLVRSVA